MERWPGLRWNQHRQVQQQRRGAGLGAREPPVIQSSVAGTGRRHLGQCLREGAKAPDEQRGQTYHQRWHRQDRLPGARCL